MDTNEHKINLRGYLFSFIACQSEVKPRRGVLAPLGSYGSLDWRAMVASGEKCGS